MTTKQKIIAVLLSVIFIWISSYLIFFKYGEEELFDYLEHADNINNNLLLTNTPITLERYRILSISFHRGQVYAILHLDNGNIRVIEITEAYIDPEVKNVEEAYLYRDNTQIYIKKD